MFKYYKQNIHRSELRNTNISDTIMTKIKREKNFK